LQEIGWRIGQIIGCKNVRLDGPLTSELLKLYFCHFLNCGDYLRA
jgi:hypothetical protein